MACFIHSVCTGKSRAAGQGSENSHIPYGMGGRNRTHVGNCLFHQQKYQRGLLDQSPHFWQDGHKQRKEYLLWVKPTGFPTGRSVTEVQGSEGCSYSSKCCSWYEGRRSSYLLFKYRQGACGAITSVHNARGAGPSWPLDVQHNPPHPKCQTAASGSPWIPVEKSPCVMSF